MHTQKPLAMPQSVRLHFRCTSQNGCRVSQPADYTSAQPRQRFFCAYCIATFFRVRIMAGRTGPTSVGPGSCVAGTANLVRLATHSFAALDGEFSQLTTQGATPWQTANHTALSRSVVTSRLKSTADFPAHHASRKSCTSICCMSAATHYQTFIPPLFSAIWRMICTSFNSSSSSKTNSINSCSGPFLHLAAGGLRTSVTRGLPQ